MQVDGRELARALAVVKPAVNRRKGGIFECIRLATDEDGRKLTVTADDCDTRIERVIDCNGPLRANVKYSDLLPWLDAGSLYIDSMDNGLVRVLGEYYQALLETIDDEKAVVGMPLNAPIGGGVILNREDLDEIAALRPMCCTDESRGVLTHVRLNGSEYAATDTHRLALIDHGKDLGPGRSFPVRLLKMLKQAEGPFSVRWGDCRIQVDSADHQTRWTGFVNGDNINYPDYHKAIPYPGATTLRITMHWIDFLLALEKLQHMDWNYRVTAHMRGGSVHLSSKCGAIGSASCGIEAKIETDREALALLADEVRADWHIAGFAFNCRYMLDGLRFIGGDEVCLELVYPLAPIVMRSGNRTYVLMPMGVE